MGIKLNESFFEQQNTFLKIFIILIGIVISASVDFHTLLIIFTFTLIYIIIHPYIYLRWLKTPHQAFSLYKGSFSGTL